MGVLGSDHVKLQSLHARSMKIDSVPWGRADTSDWFCGTKIGLYCQMTWGIWEAATHADCYLDMVTHMNESQNVSQLSCFFFFFFKSTGFECTLFSKVDECTCNAVIYTRIEKLVMYLSVTFSYPTTLALHFWVYNTGSISVWQNILKRLDLAC